MQHSAIHDPRALSTPSQRRAADMRAARIGRINALAKPDRPLACLSASVRTALAVTPQKAAKKPSFPDYGVMWFYNLVFETEVVLPRILAAKVNAEPGIKNIQRACARHYGVTVNDITSARRTADVVRPRQVAVFLARKLTSRSLPEISRCFGGRDHTTALSASRKIERLLETEEGLRDVVNKLARSLGGWRE